MQAVSLHLWFQIFMEMDYKTFTSCDLSFELRAGQRPLGNGTHLQPVDETQIPGLEPPCTGSYSAAPWGSAFVYSRVPNL
jgi:hypothetical protein